MTYILGPSEREHCQTAGLKAMRTAKDGDLVRRNLMKTAAGPLRRAESHT